MLQVVTVASFRNGSGGLPQPPWLAVGSKCFGNNYVESSGRWSQLGAQRLTRIMWASIACTKRVHRPWTCRYLILYRVNMWFISATRSRLSNSNITTIEPELLSVLLFKYQRLDLALTVGVDFLFIIGICHWSLYDFFLQSRWQLIINKRFLLHAIYFILNNGNFQWNC